MHASHYDCQQQQQQQSTISHSLTRIAFSIIYVFMLNKNPIQSTKRIARANKRETERCEKIQRTNTTSQHVISECAAVCLLLKRVCGRMNSFPCIFSRLLPPHTHTHTQYLEADKRKIREIILKHSLPFHTTIRIKSFFQMERMFCGRSHISLLCLDR